MARPTNTNQIPAAVNDTEQGTDQNEGRSALFRPNFISSGPLSGYGCSSVQRLYGDIELTLLEEIHKSIIGQNRENIPFMVKMADDAMSELLRINDEGKKFNPSRRCSSQKTSLERIDPNGWKLESSMDSCVVKMSQLTVVKAFVDMDEWVSVFSKIVPMAIVLEQILPVKQTFDETLQLVLAEYHSMTTPIIPTRKSVFVRYCKKLNEGIWAIVDVSVDSLLPATATPMIRCRRRPSGFIITELPNGYTKVIGIENVAVDDEPVHPLVRHVLNTCHAYGAGRWVAELERQCKRGPMGLGYRYVENKSKIWRLSERMVLRFCGGITNSRVYPWTRICGDGIEEIRITSSKEVRKKHSRGIKMNGKYVCASTTIWLPVSPAVVFPYLRDERNRPMWDTLSIAGVVEELRYYTNAQEAGNVVSILKVKKKDSSSMDNCFILQETKTVHRTSYVVYAVVDRQSMNELLRGDLSDNNIAISPCGFSILSCKTPPHYIAGNSMNEADAADVAQITGTLLTLGFQVLIDPQQNSNANADAAIKTLTNMVVRTVKNVSRCLKEAGDKAS